MANFQIPQFIEQKPKIVGPLTLNQFFYIAGAAALSFTAFYIFNFFLWVFVSIFLAAISISLAFIKINGQELPRLLLSAIGFFWQPRTYTWQRLEPQTTIDVSSLEKIETLREKMSIQEKLKSIALGLTTSKLLSFKGGRAPKPQKKFETVTYMTGEKRVAKKVDY